MIESRLDQILNDKTVHFTICKNDKKKSTEHEVFHYRGILVCWFVSFKGGEELVR